MVWLWSGCDGEMEGDEGRKEGRKERYVDNTGGNSGSDGCFHRHPSKRVDI